jgi:hypothetical protein
VSWGPQNPRPPLGVPVVAGSYGLFTRQSYYDDGYTTEALYVADVNGVPMTEVSAQALAALLQTAAADAEQAPMTFVVLPLMLLPGLPNQ